MTQKKKKFRLKILFQEIDLEVGEYIIGRSSTCNLTLEDPLISRRHIALSISPTSAFVKDLGSRNGTLLNGEPLFNRHSLKHNDKFKIGSYELLFLEESRFIQRPQKVTGTLVNCPSCRIPFVGGQSKCPNCNAPIIPDNICVNCKYPIDAEDNFCRRCGTPVDMTDVTIPVELGGGSSGWTSALVDEVIEKALLVGQWSRAANLLDGKLKDIEFNKEKRNIDIERLCRICSYNIALAKGLKQSERIHWVFSIWEGLDEPMPDKTIDEIVKYSKDWHSIRGDMEHYRDALKNKDFLSKGQEAAINKISQLLKGNNPI